MSLYPCLHITGETLDDLLYEAFKLLLNEPFSQSASRSKDEGKFSELIGVNFELKNPKARLSRSDAKGRPFSALGELLWYFSGTDELPFIEYYIPFYKKDSYNGKQVYGAYGPRLFNSCGVHNQVENVITLLQDKPGSRRAIIQLFESRDITPGASETIPSIPCTCYLQLLLRDNRLHMIANMRSNDAFRGLPHDIYAFTMLQEYFATALKCELGIYKHFAGSLHLYETSKQEAEDYIKEGIQPTTGFMADMPQGYHKASINKLLELEQQIREGQTYEINGSGLDSYWKELAYLLAFFKAFKDKDKNKMIQIRQNIVTNIYWPFLDKKLRS